MSASPEENSNINNENDQLQNIISPLRDNNEEENNLNDNDNNINYNDGNNYNDDNNNNYNEDNNDNNNDDNNDNNNDNNDNNNYNNNYNIEKENGHIPDNVQDNFSNTNKEASQPAFPPKNINDDYPYYFKYSNSNKGDAFHKTRKFFPSYNKEYQINQLNQLNEIFHYKKVENIPNAHMIENINYNNSSKYKTPLNRENDYYNYMDNKTPNDLEYNYLKKLENKEISNKENIYYNNNNNSVKMPNIINPVKIENGCFHKKNINVNKKIVLNNKIDISKENSYKNLNYEIKENKNLNYDYLCDKINFSDTLNSRKTKSNYEEINNNFITTDKINIDFNSEERLPKDIVQNNKDYLINHEIQNVAFMFKKINFQNASSDPCLIKNKYAELF